MIVLKNNSNKNQLHFKIYILYHLKPILSIIVKTNINPFLL